MSRYKHLNLIDESYTEHAKHAMWIAAQCVKMAAALVVHAAIPALFVTYASDKLDEVQAYRMRRTNK